MRIVSVLEIRRAPVNLLGEAARPPLQPPTERVSQTLDAVALRRRAMGYGSRRA